MTDTRTDTQADIQTDTDIDTKTDTGTELSGQILLASDLDRTIIPNGTQPESEHARALLRAVAGRPEVTLAYVSGRSKALMIEAFEDYNLPLPNYAIGDVGTTIYELRGTEWLPWEAWADEIGQDWQGKERGELAALLEDFGGLTLQEEHKQGRFKLSYYAPEDFDTSAHLPRIRERLEKLDIHTQLIWSIDEAEQTGLLDILPERATKFHAVAFLMKHRGFDESQTVFAGDSGNDLAVLTSDLQAVLVANARPDVRAEAEKGAAIRENLYLARGDFMGMNGNYSAGVLEGLVHFVPEVKAWLDEAMATLQSAD
ncbi:MAG: HAD-IIB family hydrolase [Trueperaceae bacterium]|nr:HAD-IIB family hydrolase [Trueperaceae bacterium]